MAIVLTSNNAEIPVGSIVRLGQVPLHFKIDISETNAGPRWIPNPSSQFLSTDFDNKPFIMYVYEHQIISYFTDYTGTDLEDTVSKFDL